jgi:transposase-like protein
MLNEEISISVLARETGVAEGTLYRWRHAAQPNGETVTATKKPGNRLTWTRKRAR